MKEKAINIRKVKNLPDVFKCQMCGKMLQTPPIKLPVGRMVPIDNKPGFYDIRFINACLDCTKDNISIVEQKMKEGLFYPVQTWSPEFDLQDAIYETNEGDKSSREIFPDSHYYKE